MARMVTYSVSIGTPSPSAFVTAALSVGSQHECDILHNIARRLKPYALRVVDKRAMHSGHSVQDADFLYISLLCASFRFAPIACFVCSRTSILYLCLTVYAIPQTKAKGGVRDCRYRIYAAALGANRGVIEVRLYHLRYNEALK
jgi:hypothetical protein